MCFTGRLRERGGAEKTKPKTRAMEIIEELEKTRRGIYAGGILYLDFAGNLDSCIALRTMVIKNGVAHIQAGGGIVADSTPEGEFDESVNKSKALLRALEGAHGAAGKGKGKSSFCCPTTTIRSPITWRSIW